MAANGISLRYQQGRSATPTPVISHAILNFNRSHPGTRSDGVVITPSHNPPRDGGFKYNPPTGGPADSQITDRIQKRANQLLSDRLKAVKRMALQRALQADTIRGMDFIEPYIDELAEVIDLQAIGGAGIKIGVDPMGGAGLDYWDPIADRYGLDLTVVNRSLDPRFAFMRLDWDGRIRMDCSSPFAMAGLIQLKDQFDIAFGNDTDFDRHGIVTRSDGLMNPNHYLSAAVWYVLRHRPDWPAQTAIGKTLVSSSMIDRVAAGLGRRVVEMPVGFKWFVDGLLSRELGFCGEESAGASFLRRNGQTWTTDKDGFILDLLAAEMTVVIGKDPAEIYHSLEQEYGSPVYERIDAPADSRQKKILAQLDAASIAATEIADEPIQQVITHAPGNGAAIGGIKVVSENGWFAARPSGTEDVYKIYAESFKGPDHLKEIQDQAQQLIDQAFRGA
jgi:phosphoglucomutase